MALHDRRTLGKLSPATIPVIAVMLPVQIVGAWIARSGWWTALALGLVSGG